MEQKNTQSEVRSSCTWEGLEGVVREQGQGFIQAVLAEEGTALLERPKAVRRVVVDGPEG